MLLLLIALSVTGYGSDPCLEPGPGGTDLGSFKITYDGDASGTTSGPTFFLRDEIETGGRTIVRFSVFNVEIEDKEDGFGLGELGRQPGPGTYDIHNTTTDDPPGGSFGLIVYEDTNDLSVESTDGGLQSTDPTRPRDGRLRRHTGRLQWRGGGHDFGDGDLRGRLVRGQHGKLFSRHSYAFSPSARRRPVTCRTPRENSATRPVAEQNGDSYDRLVDSDELAMALSIDPSVRMYEPG